MPRGVNKEVLRTLFSRPKKELWIIPKAREEIFDAELYAKLERIEELLLEVLNRISSAAYAGKFGYKGSNKKEDPFPKRSGPRSEISVSSNIFKPERARGSSFSMELIEEFIRDNPWRDFLRKKGNR